MLATRKLVKSTPARLTKAQPSSIRPPLAMIGSTPKRAMRCPVKNDGRNIATMWAWITVARCHCIGGRQAEIPEEGSLHALQQGRRAQQREAVLVERDAGQNTEQDTEQGAQREAGAAADGTHEQRRRDGGGHDPGMCQE